MRNLALAAVVGVGLAAGGVASARPWSDPNGRVTFSLFFRAAGIPTYGVGGVFIRVEDEFSHGLNERVPVESFYAGLSH